MHPGAARILNLLRNLKFEVKRDTSNNEIVLGAKGVRRGYYHTQETTKRSIPDVDKSSKKFLACCTAR